MYHQIIVVVQKPTYSIVWRPMHHRVEDRPLAVCDAQTVEEDDLVETDLITVGHQGKSMYGMYKARHKWHYLKHQTPEEVTLIKIFDSDPDVRAQCEFLLFVCDFDES